MTNIFDSIARKRTRSVTVPDPNAATRAELRRRQQLREIEGKRPMTPERLAGLKTDTDKVNFCLSVLKGEYPDER